MKRLLKIGILTTAISVSLIGLDIPTYYELDLKAMEMTLEGSKERLNCLQEACPLVQQYAVDDKVQQAIQELYAEEDTTPSKHIGFYTQHSAEAETYYDSNASLKEQYSLLEEQIEEVNSELKTIMEGRE